MKGINGHAGEDAIGLSVPAMRDLNQFCWYYKLSSSDVSVISAISFV